MTEPKMGQAKVIKELINLPSGNKAEVIYFERKEKQVICFSTQLNCAVGCKFCASPGPGRTVNLSVEDMMVQVEHMLQYADMDKLMLFSIMGEGEPLLNYKNVIDVIHKLPSVHNNCKVSLSTSGVAPDKIVQLGREKFSTPFKLQLSLHSANDEVRRSVIPISKSIDDLRDAMDGYRIFKGMDTPIDINITLIVGVNDSLASIMQIADKFGDYHIKLSKYNPILREDFTGISDDKIDMLMLYLDSRGVSVECHQTDGSGVGAACGQTRGMRV